MHDYTHGLLVINNIEEGKVLKWLLFKHRPSEDEIETYTDLVKQSLDEFSVVSCPPEMLDLFVAINERKTAILH